jgi:hypothetical protein
MLVEAERDLDRREPQVPLRELARPIVGALQGSGGTNNGRNSATRTFSCVPPRSQPIRSAITVAGIRGHAASSSRICGSTASTSHGRRSR